MAKGELRDGDFKKYVTLDCCLGGPHDCDDPIGEPGYLLAQEIRRARTPGFVLNELDGEMVYAGPGRRYVLAASPWREHTVDTRFPKDRGDETYTELLFADYPLPGGNVVAGLLPAGRRGEILPLLDGIKARFDEVREDREREDEREDCD